MTHVKDFWLEKLSLSPNNLITILEKGILKPVKDGLTLVFVGELVCNSSYAFSLPKCISINENTNYSIDITKAAIKKYHQKLKKNNSVLIEQIKELHFINDYPAKEFEAYLALRNHFSSNGPYRKSIVSTTINQTRKTFWKKTIQSSGLLISDESAFYPEPYCKQVTKVSNEITVVYLSIFNYLCNKYDSTQNLISSIEGSGNIIPFEEILKNADYFCRKIQIETYETFNTEDLNVLSIMLQILSDKLQSNGEMKVLAYGTNYFHLVWEDICSDIFRNDYSAQIEEFSQPNWLIQATIGENNFLPKGKLRPDVIWKDGDTNYILDAKYYYPFPDSSCGVGDISKQYIYAEASNSIKTKNGFIFPESKKGTLVNAGLSVMLMPDGSEDPSFSTRRISAFLLDFHDAIDSYLSDSPLKDFRELLKAQF